MTRLLRVASYNLLHGVDLTQRGAVDLAAATRVVADLDADVVALQEVDRGQERSGCVDQVTVLADALGYHGVFTAALHGSPDTSWVPAGDEDGPAYGVGLLSRLPVADVRRVRLPGGGAGRRGPRASLRNPGWDREPRVALTATLGRAGRLAVTVTHLSYLPWRAVRQLRTAAGARVDGPALLLGDLNLPAALVRTTVRGWRHAGGAPTFPAWAPRVQMHHLLTRGDVSVHHVAAHPRSTSDHRPLVADVRVR